MRVQIFKAWERMRSSFWFLPAVMTGGAMVLAVSAVALDQPITNVLTRTLGWTFTGGAEAASSLLGAIAGSMITIAGVVFSMTLLTLSLASSQLGPRLLRNFMRDTITQILLGTFVATFVYCLIVLRTIRHAEEITFVPHLSVSLAVVLAVVNMGLLIYFIHHVSVSIQANHVVALVGGELIKGTEKLYPENIGRGAAEIPAVRPDAHFHDTFNREARSIDSATDGYLQFVDGKALMALATQEDIVIQLELRPGHYVIASRPLALVWPGHKVTDQLTKRIRSAFALGNQRSSGQDIEFAVNQLVEIALRALSPGVNDPFTAMACVDHLGSALCRLAQRSIPSSYRYDSQDQLRIITPVFAFPAITDNAFNQIRQYSRSSTAVTIRMLEAIGEIAEFANRADDRAALLRHARMIARGAREAFPEEKDRQEVDERFQNTQKLLSGP